MRRVAFSSRQKYKTSVSFERVKDKSRACFKQNQISLCLNGIGYVHMFSSSLQETRTHRKTARTGSQKSCSAEQIDDGFSHSSFSISEKHSPEDDVTVIEPPSCLSGKLYEMFQDIMTKRPLLGKSHNFLRGLEFHKDYSHQKKFIEWKGNCNKELAALCR